MSGKYIIFVTDDFGMTHSINMGIVKAMTRGLATATNFMVPAPWFNESLLLARNKNLEVGIHLNITCEWENFRWRPITGVSSISDRDGTFYRSYQELIDHADPEDIYREYKAQIEYLLKLKWKITHIDTHMLPPILRSYEPESKVVPIVEKVAREYGLIYLYGCDDDKYRYFDSYYEKSGSGEAELYNHLSGLTQGFHLIVTHSAVESEEQLHITPEDSSPYSWALEYRKDDLSLLTSDKLKNYLNEKGFERISVQRMLELQNISQKSSF